MNKCMICGEPIDAPRDFLFCNHCFKNRDIPFPEGDNWQNHPGVIKRRKEIGWYKTEIERICDEYFAENDVIQWESESLKTYYCADHIIEEIKRARLPAGDGNIEWIFGIDGESYLSIPRDIIRHYKDSIKDDKMEIKGGMEPTNETTHTFTAEQPDGRVVEMPAPGDNWTETKRDEFKRGDRGVRNLDYMKYNLNERYFLLTFDKCNISDCFKITSEGACWAKEMLGAGAPILSIATWTRETPKNSYDYRDASEDNHIGLEIWPGREDQQRQDEWNAIPHPHREPSSFNSWCLEGWPERDDEVE